MVRQVMLVAMAFGISACTQRQVNAPSPVGGRNSSVNMPSGNTVGMGSSKAAVEGFMAAVKKADLQAMSTIWGNEKGPGRDQFKRDELEKRLIVMQCLLQHDRWSLVDDSPQLKTGGRQTWSISLARRGASAKTTLTTVQGPGGRWFLTDADLAPLRDFCS